MRIFRWATGSVIRIGLLVIVGGLLVIQLVPYGRDHANPPVTRQVQFDNRAPSSWRPMRAAIAIRT